MDIISGLPDDVLVKILSLVPTKVAASTCILSKRWKFLWMWLTKLKYSGSDTSLPSLRDFIDKNLPLHRAPVIESLNFDLCALAYLHIKPEDMKLWIEIAVSRCVRELEISHYSTNYWEEYKLPSSLFNCSSLVILTLKDVNLVNVPSMVCLPSLKSLKLDEVMYGDKERLQELLSICHVLEDLEVCVRMYDNMKGFTVIVPSLQKLSLSVSPHWGFCGLLEGYEIDTPSLEYLRLNDYSKSPSLFKNMPKLKEAYVVVPSFKLKSVIGSITSVKRLTICSEDLYGDNLVFDQLEHLELCICQDDSSTLLAQMLKDSPNLRVLDICELDSHLGFRTDPMVNWNQPSFVPECLLSSLQNFNWGPYFVRQQEKEIAIYVLKNARHLKTVTIVDCEHCDFDVSILEDDQGVDALFPSVTYG